MGFKTPSFTLKESLVVLDEALHLLRTPERWTHGKWKCPVLTKDPDTGYQVQKTDKDGRPMYAYCIEGAVNQAVINKFGPIRAQEVGALRPDACPIGSDPLDFGNEALDVWNPDKGGNATDLISLNDIVVEFYGAEFGWRKGERVAMTLNDSGADRSNTYDRIMQMLKTRRERIADALREKFPSAA